MLRTDLTDHRGTDDARLLSALADGDAIALAEAYHRTVTAAHACARRLLASPVEIEALMRAVYSDLWEEPPDDTSLEGWVRARCFNLGAGYLRQRNLRAPSTSLAAYTSGVEADGQSGTEPLERIIAELTDKQREALVRAHDQGVRTAEQDDPEAGWSLLHALLVLASPLTDDERHAAEMCSSGVALANWIFGLLPPHEASTVPGTAAEPTPCGRLAGVLRRARRRFEPLPPTPDMGHRVLASVLSNGAVRQGPQARESNLDSDLRVAYADVGRSQPSADEPPSSLDMTIPASLPSHAGDADRDGYPNENGRGAPRGWGAPEDERPTPLRAAGPPALAASSPPPNQGNAALAPSVQPDPNEPVSDDLVRMPLRRSGPRAPLGPGDDSGPHHESATSPLAAPSPLPSGDPSILNPGAADADADATLPPTGIRSRRDDADRRGPAAPPGGLRGFEIEDGPAQSPLRPDERRSPRDAGADSPLRRPAPQARGFDTQAPPPPGRPAPPPRALDATARSPFDRDDDARPPFDRDDGARSPFDRDDGARSPFDRDDSTRPPFGRDDRTRPPSFQREEPPRPPVRHDDARFGDVFSGHDDPTVPPAGSAASTTTAAMPAVRRREAPPTAGRGPAGQPSASPTMTMEDDEDSGGAGILRWIVVLVLIALGAAFGIWLGQMLIG